MRLCEKRRGNRPHPRERKKARREPGFLLDMVDGRSASERAAQHAADHTADEGRAGRVPAAAALNRSGGRSALRLGLRAPHRLFSGIDGGGRRGCDDFRQQSLVLQPVEVAALGVAACGLPARDHRARRLVEDAGHLGVETEAVEPALHVAALALVEPDLVFRGLVGFRLERLGINPGREIAGRLRVSAILQRGNPGLRQRPELTVRIAAQIGVEFFGLVGFLDRTPELDFDLRALGCGRNGLAGLEYAAGAAAATAPGAGAPFR